MATATESRQIINTCVHCGNRWNPRYVSATGCPYCHGTGRVVLKISAEKEARIKRARKAELRRQIEATYEEPDGKLPAWNVFWAFVFHDAHARGVLELDLAYCLAHDIIRRKTGGKPIHG